MNTEYALASCTDVLRVSVMHSFPTGYEALRTSAGRLNMCMVKTAKLVDKRLLVMLEYT